VALSGICLCHVISLLTGVKQTQSTEKPPVATGGFSSPDVG